jgi:hypothetical protein
LIGRAEAIFAIVGHDLPPIAWVELDRLGDGVRAMLSETASMAASD